MTHLFRMAFRDLGRNKRRSLLSALAIALGVALLLFLSSTITGEMRGALQNTIQLQSGDLQIRALSYDENKISLKWEDLIANPQQVIDQLSSIPQIVVATPRLFASGIVTQGDNSRGVQVIGIDPASPASQPFRQGIVSGNFVAGDDLGGILIGLPLATKFGLHVGDNLNLLVNTSNGDVSQQSFVVRGIFTTNTPGYDENTVLMPLAKAQAITGAQDRASTIFILLKDRDQADAVAAAVKSSNFQVLTWHNMNELIVQTEKFSRAFMVIFYLIVLAITATVVTNTLVMAVFERTREIGILSAIGMKSRRIMAMFLAEATLLATAGVFFGLIFGSLISAYFGHFGIYIGDMGLSGGFLMGDRIYAYLTVQDAINLTIVAYVITLIASVYPASLAARMEPVQALHG